MFQFKQFIIDDSDCAMKVGTDGVLLGAWAQLPTHLNPDAEKLRVLDVGTGSGLIALMLAQRFPTVMIDAVEIDRAAATQALDNVRRSPFDGRVAVFEQGFQDFALRHHSSANGEQRLYQLIVSNPPFFEETLLSPSAARARARHATAGLSFQTLIEHSAKLLCDGGHLQLILPKTAEPQILNLAQAEGLQLMRCCSVCHTKQKPPKRVLLDFQKTNACVATQYSNIVLSENGKRSPEYEHLCEDFYL